MINFFLSIAILVGTLSLVSCGKKESSPKITASQVTKEVAYIVTTMSDFKMIYDNGDIEPLYDIDKILAFQEAGHPMIWLSYQDFEVVTLADLDFMEGVYNQCYFTRNSARCENTLEAENE